MEIRPETSSADGGSLSSMFDVAAFYRFVVVDDPHELRDSIHNAARIHGVRGTILVAREGINGTIAGADTAVTAMLTFLRNEAGFAELTARHSRHGSLPFRRLKVQVKREIVTLGVGPVDVQSKTGIHVAPDQWNELLADPDVVVIDARNDFEVRAGTFANALNPRTSSFTEFPQWARSAPELSDQPKVAMFCTGGIRCEKASAYLADLGFDEVYQLDGGILSYLETMSPSDSRWEGECVVFDQRQTLDHNLTAGSLELCHACSQPIVAADRTDRRYETGVSCPRCHDHLTEVQRAGFRERHRQSNLAERRNN